MNDSPIGNQALAPGRFWQSRTLEDLAREQGIQPAENLSDLLGQGADLWTDDAEFQNFLDWLEQSRRSED